MRLQAYAHAMQEYPRESCGLIVESLGRATYWPCDNIASSVECFVLCPSGYAAAADAGDIVAVVHSHPDMPPSPSIIDKQACQASGLPWHILSVPVPKWTYLEPAGHTLPLLGREWIHAEQDCYTLIRDWYRINGSIYLADYERQENWWDKGDDLYVQQFSSEGFYEIKIDEIKPGDSVLMRVGSKVPNHAAVYVGDNMILHHVQGRLSGRDVFNEQWRRRVTHVLRYADDLAFG